MHGALIALLDDTKVLVDIMCEIKTLAFPGEGDGASLARMAD
jgi:hypothetical protein